MRERTGNERGGILIIALIMVVIVASLCLASVLVTHSDMRQADFLVHRTQALYVAQAGIEDVIRELTSMRSVSRLDNPFAWYDTLAGQALRSGSWLTKDGVSVGQYDVNVTQVNAVDQWTRDVLLRASGYVSSEADARVAARTIDAVVRVSVGRSEVFDYVYFINNWGWYYGATILANGNVRSNGQFDGGNYSATLNAIPRFEKLSGSEFTGYRDDGGIFSGWNVIQTSNMRGDVNALWTQADADAGKCPQEEVGQKKSIHSYQQPIPMPNLTDLTMYESLAKAKGSYIKVGSTVVANSVLGDDAGEKQNLYLSGTTSAPIEVHGPVVVRGSVIISGVVKGQGSIYSGGNVYVPKNLTYKTPPSATPTDPTKTQMESWITSNGSADALGLFARKHVVVGDYTNSSWQSYVSSWVNDSRNESKEDAGQDGIPNTRKGRDGILHTADDDVLENDGAWTTERYTTSHQSQGVIPPGKNVGDAIAGTGEDINGDGLYTPRCAMSEFNIPASLTSTNWAGNVPSGTPSYSSISTTSGLTRLDAAFYTNHHIAMLTTATGQDMVFNGCIVSRNESIIYATNRLILNYDYRLLDEGESFGFYLPKVWRPVELVFWKAD